MRERYPPEPGPNIGIQVPMTSRRTRSTFSPSTLRLSASVNPRRTSASVIFGRSDGRETSACAAVASKPGVPTHRPPFRR